MNDKKERGQFIHIISYHIMSYIILYIIPWIHTRLKNLYGYGNSQIYLRNLEAKSI